MNLEAFDNRLKKLEDQSIARLIGSARSAFLRLIDALRRAWLRYSKNGDLLPNEKATLILRELDGLFPYTDLEIDVTPTVLQQQQEVVKRAEEFAQSQLPKQELGAVERIAGGVIAGVLYAALMNDAKATNDRVKGYGQQFKSSVIALVGFAVSRGDGVQKVLRGVRGEWGKVKNKVELVIKTEGNRIVNNVLVTTYKAFGIQEWIWKTAGDDRVCPKCAPKNGRKYRVGDPQPPEHPRCRCYCLPAL